MSFYSTLKFYRPRAAPRLAGKDMAAFVRRLFTLELTRPNANVAYRLKFGSSIDLDDHPTSWREMLNEVIGVEHEIEWDVKETGISGLDNLAERLSKHTDSVYRGYVELGLLAENALDAMTLRSTVGDDVAFRPDWIAIEVGPITIARLSSPRIVHCGWISVNFFGYGYLSQHSLEEAVHRAESAPAIRSMCNLCRTHWPVPRTRPGLSPEETTQARRVVALQARRTVGLVLGDRRNGIRMRGHISRDSLSNFSSLSSTPSSVAHLRM